MVTDHATEPANLLPLMGNVVAHVGRGHHADVDGFGVAAFVSGCRPHGCHGPFEDLWVGQLQDKSVGMSAHGVEGFRAITGRPHR